METIHDVSNIIDVQELKITYGGGKVEFFNKILKLYYLTGNETIISSFYGGNIEKHGHTFYDFLHVDMPIPEERDLLNRLKEFNGSLDGYSMDWSNGRNIRIRKTRSSNYWNEEKTESVNNILDGYELDDVYTINPDMVWNRRKTIITLLASIVTLILSCMLFTPALALFMFLIVPLCWILCMVEDYSLKNAFHGKLNKISDEHGEKSKILRNIMEESNESHYAMDRYTSSLYNCHRYI